ncbi:glutathione synthase [Pterulicium gracile]|uniref:Glutathione synthetase n=1 Tax=Pterulicium gracile TaxID=1884261 RepID=A0A5C3QLG0_9AGAR|nr:glutathione synthase [Pterula gracilis]
MPPFAFSNWPPSLSEDQLQELTLIATSYALSHGLLYLPVAAKQPPAPSSAIHAPLSLFPSPFPRQLFEQAQKLQHIYNTLYARIAMDEDFLDEVMGAVDGVGAVDEFVGQLWKGWKQVRDEDAVPLQLGLFRSDYLLHSTSDPPSLKQVEFNTISSSFGTLSDRVAGLHRYILFANGYYDSSPHLKAENFPPNNTTAGLAQGLAAAHEAYNVPGSSVLFVVQPGERNVFDQRWLEYELLERHSIKVIRQTMSDLAQTASIDLNTKVLTIKTATLSTPVEISTIYFRACYTPTDFPDSAAYELRFLLERSRAIKCPSIPLQLAGGKKVQQVLCQPGILERFLTPADASTSSFSQEDISELRASWMYMWGMDLNGDEGVEKALTNHGKLVLKPQREGGGNNVYKASIPPFLRTLDASERQAWIAMELIEPPEGLGGYLVRAAGPEQQRREHEGEQADKVVRADVVSELGIFGWALFGLGKVNRDEEVGWLVRTKGKDSDEGGVATGFSVLDSLVLV